MLISKKNNFLFYHVYKVAGTSIRDVLIPYCSRSQAAAQYVEYGLSVVKIPHRFAPIYQYHPKLSDVRDYLGDSFYDYYRFSFVRDPFDWQKSLYFFMKKNTRHHQHKLVSSMDFESYINWRMDNDLHLMSDLISDSNGEVLIENLFRFENIDEEFDRLKGSIGIEGDLPLKNIAGRGQRVEISEITKKRFLDVFSKDYEVLGYEPIINID